MWSPALHAVAEGNVKLLKFLSKEGVFWNISLRQSTYLDETTFKPDYDLDIPQALLITASSKKQSSQSILKMLLKLRHLWTVNDLDDLLRIIVVRKNFDLIGTFLRSKSFDSVLLSEPVS